VSVYSAKVPYKKTNNSHSKTPSLTARSLRPGEAAGSASGGFNQEQAPLWKFEARNSRHRDGMKAFLGPFIF